SDVPLRSAGCLAMNHSLLAAGVVDFIQVTIFPVLTGHSGSAPVLGGVDDYDLELIDSKLLDGRTQELRYRPTRHHPARASRFADSPSGLRRLANRIGPCRLLYANASCNHGYRIARGSSTTGRRTRSSLVYGLRAGRLAGQRT